MSTTSLAPTLARSFAPVNISPRQLPLFEPMAHSKVTTYHNSIYNRTSRGVPYCVPSSVKLLPPGLLVRRHDRVVEYLKRYGLAPRERDAVLLLLRLYSYYGKVFVSAGYAARDAVISRRTFWRAVAVLVNAGVLQVINRYQNGKQRSNLYDLRELVRALLRYLAEHGSELCRQALDFILGRLALPLALQGRKAAAWSPPTVRGAGAPCESARAD